MFRYLILVFVFSQPIISLHAQKEQKQLKETSGIVKKESKPPVDPVFKEEEKSMDPDGGTGTQQTRKKSPKAGRVRKVIIHENKRK